MASEELKIWGGKWARGKKIQESKEGKGLEKGQGEKAASKIYANTDMGETNIKAEGINKVRKILEGGNSPPESQLVLWPRLIMKFNSLKTDSGNLLMYSCNDFTINFRVFPIRSGINF